MASSTGDPPAVVLVTDGQQRKALAAVRSLGRAGHRPLVAEEMWLTTSFFSRFAAGRAVYPSPLRGRAVFGRWLAAFVRAHGVEVLLAMDDATLEAALETPPPCAGLFPPPEAFHLFRDKAATLQAAARVGVSVPRWVVADTEPERALRQAEALGYPVVLKPRVSSGGRGLVLAEDPAALVAALAAQPGQEPLLQGWVGWGAQYDVGLLYDAGGRRVAAFVQRELRHYPLTGGPSTVQESVQAPELVRLADRLLASAGWIGPAEVEFRLDAAGVPRLMEVNPRYWASLALAIQCGVDFPRLHVALALGRPVEPVLEYAVGRRCRWLLPGDILHYLANPRRAEMDPPLLGPADPPLRDDILDAADPLPALGFALAAAAWLCQPGRRRMVLRGGSARRPAK